MGDVARSATPSLDLLDSAFRTGSPIFRDAVHRAREALGEDWATSFDQALARLLVDDDERAGAVDAYSRFALDALRLQAQFDKDGVYAARPYAAVVADVYANEAYMTSRYLPGLLLSNYLWPHHYRQVRYFEEFFVADMVRIGAESFCDVGVGTGLYSRLVLEAIPTVVGLGIDISPSSKAYAERHVAAFGAADRYQVELRNIVADPGPQVDRLVCVEVLEHLEDPEVFLRALRAMLRPGGKGFIGTALNAANADHIYLYRTIDEIRVQIARAGFTIDHGFFATAMPPADPARPVPEVAAFMVS